MRQADLDLPDEIGNARDDFRRGVARLAVVLVAAVVRADEQDDHLRAEAVEFAVLDAPQNILDAVVADAEIGGVARRECLLPNSPATGVPVPAVGDGIANEQQVNATFPSLGNVAFMAGHPVRREFARRRDEGGVLGAGLQGKQRGQRERDGQEFHGRGLLR